MPSFMPTLGMGLRMRGNASVNLAAISITSSVAISLGDRAAAHFPTFLPEVMEICNSDAVDPLIKPDALSCIGDLCWTAGAAAVSPNLGPIVEMLSRAQLPTLSGGDEDAWVVDLRTNVLAVYSGIMGTFRTASASESELMMTRACCCADPFPVCLSLASTTKRASATMTVFGLAQRL
jgi:hypothetical protein